MRARACAWPSVVRVLAFCASGKSFLLQWYGTVRCTVSQLVRVGFALRLQPIAATGPAGIHTYVFTYVKARSKKEQTHEGHKNNKCQNYFESTKLIIITLGEAIAG